MIMLSAMRDFAEGLTRGFSLFLTERQNTAERALSPGPGNRPRARR